jgi:hypothetical protein
MKNKTNALVLYSPSSEPGGNRPLSLPAPKGKSKGDLMLYSPSIKGGKGKEKEKEKKKVCEKGMMMIEKRKDRKDGWEGEEEGRGGKRKEERREEKGVELTCVE